MARADLLCELIKSGLTGDETSFRKATEAISAEERSKQHEILAQKIDEMLKTYSNVPQLMKKNPPHSISIDSRK